MTGQLTDVETTLLAALATVLLCAVVILAAWLCDRRTEKRFQAARRRETQATKDYWQHAAEVTYLEALFTLPSAHDPMEHR